MLARLGRVIEISQVLHMAVHGRILGVGQCALDIRLIDTACDGPEPVHKLYACV